MTEQERVEAAYAELTAIQDKYGVFLDVGVTKYVSGREVPTAQFVTLPEWTPAPPELAPDTESA